MCVGPSNHETFDPKPNAPQPFKGHFEAIPTAVDGIQLPEHLVKCADCMDKWSIVRGLHHDNNSHSSAHEIMHSGYKAPVSNQQQNFYPSIGSTISEHAKGGDVPAYVVIPNHNNGTRPGYLPHEFGPYETKNRPSSSNPYKDTNFTLDDALTANIVDNRSDLLKAFDSFRTIIDKSGMVDSINEFNTKARGLLTSGTAANAFNIEKETTFTKNLYGDGFGRDLLLARRLVESGVKMVTVKTPFSWDTHNNSDKRMGEGNLPQFDKAFGALISEACWTQRWSSRGANSDELLQSTLMAAGITGLAQCLPL